MDWSNLVPAIAAQLGLAPTTLLSLLIVIYLAASAGAKLIPDNATGWLGALRAVCSIVGIEISSRLSSGVTVKDVSKTALSFPEVQAKLASDDDAVATKSSPPPPKVVAMLCLLPIAMLLASCAAQTQLSVSQGFGYTQLGFKALQQASYACITTNVQLCVDNKTAIIAAIDKGQIAETAGYTAQQAHNQSALIQATTDLAAAIAALQQLGVN